MYGIKNTKQNRLESLKYQFESLEKKGYKKQVYKDLNIFVKNEDGKWYLSVFIGTSTKNVNKYYYRTEERMQEAIDGYKKSADYREKRKADAKNNKRLSGHAATAKAIREELKKAFPKIKFSVKSESFSMGNSVHINWFDGLTTKEVESITNKYQYGHFNGMEDIYENTNSRDDIPQAKYVSCSRSMSDETETILLPFAEEIYKECDYNCHNANNLLYRLFCQTSFPVGAIPTGIKRNGNMRGLNDISTFYVITFDTDKEPEPEKTEDEDEYIDFAAELLSEENDEKQAKIEEYNDRKAAKAERYKKLAEKARNQSESAYQAAKKIGDFIPFGQPILVGHHSEGRHRRDLSKIDNNMRKSIQLDEKAEYYENKAKNVENSNVISSDDPEAIDKLKNKLKRLQANQELMKSANKIIKNRFLPEVEKVEQLQNLGLTEKQSIEIMSPGHFGGAGFASFSLTNNNANINTVKKRIEYLEKLQSQESKKIEINGVKVIDNVDANRLQIFFDSIPGESKRTELKKNGFRWSPSNKCWQSYRNSYQITRAKKILKNT
jgi:hypothetical protein